MSRQSSLAEDRISSDEDEFQEERSGTSLSHANGVCFRAHSLPTPCAIVHLSFPMARRQDNRQIRTSSSSSGQYGRRRSRPSEYCASKRVPPEPDLIREILAQKPSGQSGDEKGINLNLPFDGDSDNTHVAVRETRSSPALQGMVTREKDGEGGKKRRKFKLRSCLIRSCISH